MLRKSFLTGLVLLALLWANPLTHAQSSFTFTDDPLTSQVTLIKAVHITELRDAINTLRSNKGLGAFSFTDPTLTAGVTPVRAVHLTDLRTALNGVYDALGQTQPTYTDQTITSGSTVVKKTHIDEIRSAVKAVEPFTRTVSSAGNTSGASAITTDGSTVFVVNPDSGSVSAVDTRSDEKVGEVFVGDDPRALALGPEGRLLYVTCQASAKLAVLDPERLSVLAKIQVGADPYGVVADPGGNLVYVASSATATVEVVDVSLRDVIAQIPVGPKPKGLALSADGTRLYVTHFLSGEVSVIDPVQRSLLQVISTGSDSNMAQKIVLHPTNGKAYLPHIRSNVTNRGLLFDSTVFPVISVIDLTSNQHVGQERVDLSLGENSVNLPFDLSFSPDGQLLYVVNLGSGDMSVIDLNTRRKITTVDVGDGPRGIVLTPDGRRAYVFNSLSEDVSVIDLTAHQEIARIAVTKSLLDPEVKRGKLLFFSSRSPELSKDRWMSCASCHFEGEHDGRTWFSPRGPRNTITLRAVGETRPIHWSADRDEVQDFEFTIRGLQAGTGLLRDGFPNPKLGPPNAGLSADLDALAAYVEALQPKPSPFRNPDGSLTLEANQGQLIFQRPDVGCADCHTLPRFTDSSMDASPFITHDVGTGDGPDERLDPVFDTPSLLGLWDSAPYLHDGSAPTLRDVLTTKNPEDRHGQTSHLSEAELMDLIAFLLSLGEPPL
ncbi:MAG: beta-propeller fold lactonase family protein [Acidobacteriota bacterium]